MVSSGGDEVNLACWADDEETANDLARKNVSIAQALDAFIGEVQGVFKRYGKQPFIKSGACVVLVVCWTCSTCMMLMLMLVLGRGRAARQT